ncbi:MAG: response regulator [Candidatus Thiodiazotropha sp.]
MIAKIFDKEMLSNSEYQQALLRLAIWLFCCLSMWIAVQTEYYTVDVPLLITLYTWYFTFFIVLLVNVAVWPSLPHRTYFTLVIDISATSLAIYLTSDAFSPFYLIYHWIYISYGIRYGARTLLLSMLLSFCSYALVIHALQQWQIQFFETFLFLFLLLIVPVYQYTLLRQLHYAKTEAMLAKQARGDFLATMTHELRTPLIGVMGMARLLQNTPLDAEQKEYVHAINASARLLRSMISDVLDLSKIDANKLELSSEWFDVYEMVKNIIATLAPEVQEKRLEMYCYIDPDVPMKLRGDKLRISQILFNMLGNAIKFTEQGYVCLRVLYAEGSPQMPESHILFEVEDSGIGIESDKLSDIFSNFWQADGAHPRRRFEGTGLGTSVIRDLTRLMNGQVNVTSELGQGSVFSVRLPLLPRLGDRDAQGSSQTLREHFPLIRDKRVLIYESDPIALQQHLQMVEELGMQASSARDLEKFSQQLSAATDMVLVCDSLADGAVRQVIRTVRGFEPTIPLVLAGYRSQTLDYAAFNTPVLIKPYLPDELAKAVMDLLVSHHHQSPSGSMPSAPEPIKPIRPMNVLLAEDNVIAAKVLSTLLKQRGHQVRVARDGQEALQAVNESDYELAFVDLCMPHVDGIEFTRRYRKSEDKQRYMPIYALTANSKEELMDLCISAGMDGFLAKPVEPELLDSIIERCVGGGFGPDQLSPVPG